MTYERKLVVYVLIVLLFSGLLIVHVSTKASRDKAETRGVVPIPAKPVNANLFQETELGRTIWAWLGCEDFCEDELEAVEKLGSSAVSPLIQLLKYGVTQEVETKLWGGKADSFIRVRAINALGALHDERALDPLIATLADPDISAYPPTRAAVAIALSDVGGDKAFTTVLSLLHDNDEYVREVTARALGSFRRRTALPALREAAQAEQKAHVLREIEKTIHKLERL